MCFFSQLSVVNNNEQTPEAQSPLQHAFAIASVACFASLLIVCWAARPAADWLATTWAGLLVYAIIPISVTFIILYRSCWHREILGAARTCRLLLLSCAILAGVSVATGVMLFILSFGLMAMTGGNH